MKLDGTKVTQVVTLVERGRRLARDLASGVERADPTAYD